MEALEWPFDLTDTVRSASMVVAFVLLAVLGDRRVWITADILCSLGFGLTCFVFPGIILDFQVAGKLDAVHLLFGRLYGGMLMCSIIVWFMTRETRDGTVPITLMMSRVYICGLILMAQAYTTFWSTKGKTVWTNQHMYFGILGTALWLLGNLIHLLRSDDFSTYPQHNIRLNTHLRIDGWLTLVIAIAFMAFPDFIISHFFDKSPGAVHKHLVRCVGAMGIGDAVVSMQAPGFLHERDKRAQLLGRILTVLVTFVPWLWAALMSRVVSLEALTHLAVVVCFPLANALIGYLTDGTTIYHVPKSPKRD